jgi:hypothetical protein
VVHRDVSPSNILLGVDGQVKVADFGIAKAAHRLSKTQTGMVRGKIMYLSPEQAEGEPPLDHRSDQFALGAVLWEMLTGKRLFTGKSDFQILEKIVTASVPPPSDLRPDLPPGVDVVVMHALRRDREDRFADMATLDKALSKLAFDSASGPQDADSRHAVADALAGFPNLSTTEMTLPAAQEPDAAMAETNPMRSPVTKPLAEPPSADVQTSATRTLHGASPPPPARGRPRWAVWAAIAALGVVAVVGAMVGLGRLVVTPGEPVDAKAGSPRLLTIETNPPGLELAFGGTTQPAPASFIVTQGETVEVEVTYEGKRYASPIRIPLGSSPLVRKIDLKVVDRVESRLPGNRAADAAEVSRLKREATKLLMMGRAGRAVEELRKARALAPKDGAVHRGLGQALEKQGDVPSAVASYREYLRLKPGAPDREHIEARIEKLAR